VRPNGRRCAAPASWNRKFGTCERRQELGAEANHDHLTGLANRKLCKTGFRCAAERAKRSGQCFALLMVDLDRFKAVNDSHGHAAGDRVLVTMARRMEAAVRTCDIVARLGGDEFVLIIESMRDPSEIIQIGRKLVRALLQDIVLDSGVTVTVGASLGLALYPYDGAELSQMLDVADCAMYECKTSGQMELQATSLAM
jgi:diguanylate cyclase (GGDEF)-like protein